MLYKARVRQGVLAGVAKQRWGLETVVLRIPFDAVFNSWLRYCLTVMDSCLHGHVFPKVDMFFLLLPVGFRVCVRNGALCFVTGTTSIQHLSALRYTDSAPIDAPKIGIACDPSSLVIFCEPSTFYWRHSLYTLY